MSKAESSGSGQTAANASCVLAFSIILCGHLAKLLHLGLGAVLLWAMGAAIAMLAGAICSLVGFWGFLRGGGVKVLVFSLIGILVNGLLIYVFATSFMEGYNRGRRASGRGDPAPTMPEARAVPVQVRAQAPARPAPPNCLPTRISAPGMPKRRRER